MRQSNGQVSDCRCAAGSAAVSQVLPWAYQGGEGRVLCLLTWKAVRVPLLLSTRVRSFPGAVSLTVLVPTL